MSDKKAKKELDDEIKKLKKNKKETEKGVKILTGENNDDDEEDEEMDDDFDKKNEEEVSQMLRDAELEIKEEEERKKNDPDAKAEQKLVEELSRVSVTKKKAKKNKKPEKEMQDDPEYEEYLKWKEQKKMQKEKKEKEKKEKEKEKEKEKLKKKKAKKDDDDDEEDEFPFPQEEKKPKKKKSKKNADSDEEFPFPEETKKPKKKKSKKKKSDSDDYSNSDDESEENEDSEEEDNEPQGPIIPKKLYERIPPYDLKIVLNCMKKANAKYQEGLNCQNMGDYSMAMSYFKSAKQSYMGVNSLIKKKTDSYPKEFAKIMSSKLSDKVHLVHEAAKECSKLLKEQKTNFITNNPDKIQNIINNKINAALNKSVKNNYDYNFGNNNNNINNNNFNNNNNNLNNNNNNNLNNNNNTNKPKNIHDKEEDEMDQKILSEIMVKNPKVKFSDIIGMNEMKQTLYEIIVVPTIRPDLFTGIRKPQRGILLFGPPGTGKTMIAKAIATECNSTFFNISASSLTSKWVGESEKTVKSLFKIAYQKVPSIIFIDEIDSILSKRNESENEATKRLKTEFLIQFDGLGSNTNARLLVIAATNRPMDLDEALLRRLPKRVYCGPLDENGRFDFIKKVINRVETNLSDDDIRDIAKKTNDYSNSDLMELCREAAYQPVRELSTEEILKIKKFRALTKNDLDKACQKIRGTLSKRVKEELKRWNDQFGGV